MVKFLLLFIAIGAAAGCQECARYEVQDVVTYPNMAYLGLGPSYTALALMPVVVQENVCVEYKNEEN